MGQRPGVAQAQQRAAAGAGQQFALLPDVPARTPNRFGPQLRCEFRVFDATRRQKTCVRAQHLEAFGDFGGVTLYTHDVLGQKAGVDEKLSHSAPRFRLVSEPAPPKPR